MTRSHAYEVRDMMYKASASLDDEDALEAVELFPEWGPWEEYKAGYRFRYDRKLYRVVQDHTSQSDWTPDITPALYTRIADPAEEWPEWVRPKGAHDAYAKGAKCSHGGKHWISNVDGNVWEPGAVGTEALWLEGGVGHE